MCKITTGKHWQLILVIKISDFEPHFSDMLSPKKNVILLIRSVLKKFYSMNFVNKNCMEICCLLLHKYLHNIFNFVSDPIQKKFADSSSRGRQEINK